MTRQLLGARPKLHSLQLQNQQLQIFDFVVVGDEEKFFVKELNLGSREWTSKRHPTKKSIPQLLRCQCSNPRKCLQIQSRRFFELELYVVDIAPAPRLSGLGRTDDRVLSVNKVLPGMFVL